jgi:hypothetical protein
MRQRSPSKGRGGGRRGTRGTARAERAGGLAAVAEDSHGGTDRRDHQQHDRTGDHARAEADVLKPGVNDRAQA